MTRQCNAPPTTQTRWAALRLSAGRRRFFALLVLTACEASPPSPVPAATVTPPQRASTDPKAAPPAPTARLVFVGDLGMSGLVSQYIIRQQQGLPVPDGIDDTYPFAHVRERLQQADLAIGNLECVIDPPGERLVASAQPAPDEVLAPIRAAGFDVLSVANNHIQDFGPSGLKRTVERVQEAGLKTFGQDAFGAAQSPLSVTVNGLRIAFLGYHAALEPRARAEIASAAEASDLVVVYNHWGTHWASDTNAHQRKLGQAMIDAGADLVVGAHTHAVQPEEQLKDGLIVYGLGNFVFSGMGEGETFRTGAMLEIEVAATGVVDHRFYEVLLDENGAPGPVGAARSEPPVPTVHTRPPRWDAERGVPEGYAEP